jgi:hypothetical protein
MIIVMGAGALGGALLHGFCPGGLLNGSERRGLDMMVRVRREPSYEARCCRRLPPRSMHSFSSVSTYGARERESRAQQSADGRFPVASITVSEELGVE